MDFTTLILIITAFTGGILAIPVGGSFLLVIPVMLLLGLNGLETLVLSKIFAISCLAGGSGYFLIHNHYEWKPIFYFLSGNAVGSIIAAKLANSIDIETLTIIVPWILLGGAVFLVKDFKIKNIHTQKKLYFLFPFFGLLFGIYGGLGGSGTGPGSVILLSLALGLGMYKAIVNARMLELIGSSFITILYIAFGARFIGYEIPVAVAAILGGIIGAKLTIKSNPVWLKRALLLLIIVSIVKTFWPLIAKLFQ